MGDDSQDNGSDYSSFTFDETVPLRNLTPNTFYKICPKRSTPLGPPICGDGSPFCFYITRPPQRFDDGHKIMVELIGGGACWDSQTCARQSSYLYINSNLDGFLGHSCSSVQAMGLGGGNNANLALNMLCATTLRENDADLREYTSIFVPYCTQDVHTGSNTIVYNENDDDGNSMTVHHTGAHNIMSVTQYIQRQFRSLDTAVVTGCSAGGTGVPALYRLLDQHYHSTRLHVITDSPVYLTPQYFVETALPAWNAPALLQSLGLPYRRLLDAAAQGGDDYSTLLWDAVLSRTSRRNRWGFLSHTNDPVSQQYFAWMSGNNNDNNRRELEDDADAWYEELTHSIGTIQAKHSNVDTFWMDGEGHCSLGLYYGLQYENGFREWAADVVQYRGRQGQATVGRLGFLLVLTAVLVVPSTRRLRRRSAGNDDSLLQTPKEPQNGWRQRMSVWMFSVQEKWETVVASRLEPFPLTSSYMVVITLYFVIMLFDQGFAHPLNNPTIGPSANGLSRYGILNPTLVAQKGQWYRWISSNFLCSGILTYGITMANLWWRIKPLEEKHWQDTHILASYWIALLLIVNTVYSLFVGGGASISSLPVVLGLAACGTETVVSGIRLVIESLLIAALFPFHSWIMFVAALACGLTYGIVSRRDASNSRDETVAPSFPPSRLAAVGAFLLLLPLLVFFASRPNELFLQPYYTGCTLFWTDQLSSFSGMISGRRLEDQGSSSCAQVCLPRLTAPFVGLVSNGRLKRGTCQEQGYSTHSFDTTYNYMTYSLDVELCALVDDDGDN